MIKDAKFLSECMAHTLARKNINAKTFEEANLRVFERYGYNAQAVFAAVGKGGYILPVLKGSFFGDSDDELIFYSIVSVNNVKKEITIYNPVADKESAANMAEFLEAWTAAGARCITAFPMDSATYTPQHADLSDIALPDDMTALCEQLAEHAHDVWAAERQSEGWTYGPKRDDTALHNPDMVPYSQLLESEKQYDRMMATNTIKYLISCGYKIVKE